MVEVSKGLVRPAVGSRLFWEDIPFGLVILKDLALMLGLPTPRIDFMIRWHQQFMDKEYLLPNGLLNAKLLPVGHEKHRMHFLHFLVRSQISDILA